MEPLFPQRLTALFNITNEPLLIAALPERGAMIPAAVDGRGIVWTRDSGLPAPAGIPAAGTNGAPLAWFDTPAAATAPDADTPAGGVGFRNVLDTLIVTLNSVAAQGVLTVVVRDGATGAGAILWSVIIGPLGAAASQIFTISGLNIVGSDDTEMTVETTGAPAATNFCSIACTGHLAV